MHKQFATTEIHLNEYNSYVIDYPRGGSQDQYALASLLLSDYHYFLTTPHLTKVSWAQFLDSGQANYSGMITIDGHAKAVYNAYKIYQMMPVDRREVTIVGPGGISGLASTDEHTAALVLWNRSGYDRQFSITLTNLPFTKGTLQVYRIDAEHASYGDNPENEALTAVETFAVSGDQFTWSGIVPWHSVMYLEAKDESDLSDLEPIQVATVLRPLYYYPDRSKTSYAHFEKTTWTAYLGMGQEQQAEAVSGATATDLPAVFNIHCTIDGELQQLDQNSILAVRVDYMEQKQYTKSVLLHGPFQGGKDLYDVGRDTAFPWGTQQQANNVVLVEDISNLSIVLADYAPIYWDGRIQLSFLLQNAGQGTRAKFIVRKGGDPLFSVIPSQDCE